ncbi:TRAP transporter small permease subunit [Salipiger sp. PrR002]|uniref:TRAP transporter small permease subunit n=1 Tax=Salipiger sp. PrR002 TaxID=2706489 RepID=UPI0013B8B817|nr:TRAP transporter small permease [Salipiger sp. PrR002]NDW02010.1 TRAP transporter small permease [Salipiger sp. PrR002]NDW59050.1 TRAP transporter small permease [Salipiger sp. PrR004]
MARCYLYCFRLSQVAAAFACLTLLYMVGHVIYEIVLRSVFHTSTFVMDEFVGYALSGFIFFSLGYALETESLIRVTVLTQHFSDRVARIVLALASFVSVGLVILLANSYWIRVARAYKRGTVSSSIAAVPTWIPEAIILVGLALFALQLFAFGLRHLTGHASPATVPPSSPTE